MIKPPPLPPLYAIFDPTLAKGRSLETILHAFLEGGISLIQLRAKDLSSKDFFELATRVRLMTRTSGCCLIVNDRVDIAAATDADGVHLGQEDLPLAAARKIMGNKIVGISTHDLEQAREAERDGADYIGFGPMFGTTTKTTGYAARGPNMLRQIRREIKIPIVAIGGITENNVSQVWEAGADSAAMISELMGAKNISEKVRRLLGLRYPSSACS
jgi:thiamine-phosphate pyrophosphorylase